MCDDLATGGHLRKEKILKSVVSFFVEHGYLFFEEIVDKLISVDVLQTRHHEILTLAMDRQTRARKIWNLLYYVPPSKFQVSSSCSRSSSSSRIGQSHSRSNRSSSGRRRRSSRSSSSCNSNGGGGGGSNNGDLLHSQLYLWGSPFWIRFLRM